MSSTIYPTRDRSEILRSAEEARHLTVQPADQLQIARYLDPSAATVFPLEFAYHLLGDVHGKIVLDIGCGAGENLLPLIERGTSVTGMDLSPELVALAVRRLEIYGGAGRSTQVLVRSAYDTGFPDESFDVVFCIALLHHLEMGRACRELHRILKPRGFLIFVEPVRFSSLYRKLVRLFGRRSDVSDYEYPLNQEQMTVLYFWFSPEAQRYFRLPFVALQERLKLPWVSLGYRGSAKLLEWVPSLKKFATVSVGRLRKLSA
jgi:SAM-dependent methyltransferase